MERINTKKVNQQSYCWLSLLKYQISDYYRLNRDHSDEKIDRVISSLLGRGKSELTDSEYVVRSLFDKVLNEKKEDQPKFFKELCDDLYHSKSLKEDKNDNNTTVRIGENEIVRIAFDMQKIRATSEQWMRYLDFVFRYRNKTYIDDELVACLMFCNNPDYKCFLYILQQFNKLDVCLCLRNKQDYAYFLENYLRQLPRLGFCRINLDNKLIVERIDKFGCDDVFDDIEKKLKNYDSLGLTYLEDDLIIVKDFLEKNRKIIEVNSQNISEREKNISVTFSSEPPPDEEEALGDIESDEDFQKQLEQYYKDGKLKPYQVERAWNKRHGKKN